MDLRELMTVVEVPPSRADVGRAVAAGRRRSRRRAVVGAAAAVLAVAGSVAAFQQVTHGPAAVPGPLPAGPAPSAAPPPGCRVETYATPGTVNAVDDGGRYLVGALYTGETPSPVHWVDGR